MTKKWTEVRSNIDCFSQEEWDAIDLKVKLVGEIIKAREEQGITQKELAEGTGLTQSVIARLESNKNDTQLTTIFKVLNAMNLTLDIVPKRTTLVH